MVILRAFKWVFASDHFGWEACSNLFAESCPGLMSRARHCIECPRCLTRYVISRSPYSNGAYVIPAVEGSTEEYFLYCSCSGRSVSCRSKSSEVMLCHVRKAAYERGYGRALEITPVDPNLRESWPVDVGKYSAEWKRPTKNSA